MARGESFRSLEKGANRTKRLKITTYVPSFEVMNDDMTTIQKVIARKTTGNKAKCADILTAANTPRDAKTTCNDLHEQFGWWWW